MTKYTIELPEIEGFEQALNERGKPLYRYAMAGEYGRTGEEFELASKYTAESDVRVLILKKKPRQFRFGDVVDCSGNLRHLVYRVEGGYIHVLSYYWPNPTYQSIHVTDLKLIEETSEENRLLVVSRLNGERK